MGRIGLAFDPFETTQPAGRAAPRPVTQTPEIPGVPRRDYSQRQPTGEADSRKPDTSLPLPPVGYPGDHAVPRQPSVPPKPPTTPTTPTNPYAGMGYDQIIQTLQGNLPPTSDSLSRILEALNANGIAARRAKHGANKELDSDDVIILPDGTEIDLIADVGGPGARWQFSLGGGGGSASGGEVSESGYPQVGGVNLDVNSILGGDIWNDPALSLLEQLGVTRLDELFQPVEDPYRDNFFKMLDTRIGELQQYPWTGGEEETLRTSATDRLQRDRQAAHEEVDRQLATRGHDKGSGTLVKAHLEVDKQFDQLVNAQQQGFDVYALETVNERKDQAVGLGGAGAELSKSVRAEEEARRREAMTIAAMFPEMENQQLMNALAVLSGSPYSGPSIFNQMLGLAGMGSQQYQNSQNQSAGFWQALGSILGGYGNTGNSGYSGTYNPNDFDWSMVF